LPVNAPLDHEAVVAALQGGLGRHWTVTLRSARPQAPLVAMFSGALQRAEPKDDDPDGEAEFVWYVGADDKTWGAFAVPRDGFRGAGWETTPKGEALIVQISGLLLALFPRAGATD
jgi:hypothetical protein